MKSRLALGAGVVMAGAMLSACGGSGNEDLDSYLCDTGTVGPEFQELTRGDFSPRDLADLGDDADRREREFRDAGMKRGRFVLFKQSLPRPPFDPPANIVCQALQFESAEAAEAWMASVLADDRLPGLIFGSWLPEEAVTEANPAGFETTSDRRAFIASHDHASPVQIQFQRRNGVVRMLALQFSPFGDPFGGAPLVDAWANEETTSPR